MTDRREFLKAASHALAMPFCAAHFVRAATKSATLSRYPYLQNIRGDRATVSWKALDRAPGTVEFSTGTGPTRRIASRIIERPASLTGLGFTCWDHSAVLTGLAANTEYSYRVFVDSIDVLPDEELTFRTRGAGNFRFLVFGDSGMATPEQTRLAQQLNQERAALLIHTGDLVYPAGKHEFYQARYLEYYKNLMKRLPFYPCPGNHDYDTSDKAAPYLAVHDLPTEGVPEGDHGRYYSFDWGNVHFVSIDSNDSLVDAANGFGGMLEWLDKDLRNTKQFWRVVYFHHPPYAAGPNQDDPLTLLARRLIVPILDRYQVPLVFSGHEHSYQRSHPIRSGAYSNSGTVYVTSGGGGAMLYPVYPSALVARGESVFHYLRTDVQGARLSMEAIRVDGGQIEEFSLTPAPALTRNGVLNTASSTAELAAGGLVSVFGWQMSVEERSATRYPLPTQYPGISVALDGRAVPLLYVSPTQLNVQLPFGVTGTATLEVTTPNGAAKTEIEIAEIAPALFPTGAVHADGKPVTSDAPAEPGEMLTLFLTGLGPVQRQIAAGDASPAGVAVSAPVEAQFGDMKVAPAFAGLTPGFAGVYQVLARVPDEISAGTHAVRVIANGIYSNSIEMAVRAAGTPILSARAASA